jgi:cytoskeletal protein CcmA (bactofilin family)
VRMFHGYNRGTLQAREFQDTHTRGLRAAVSDERRKDQRPMGTLSQTANANPLQPPTSTLAEMPTPAPVNYSAANQYSMIGKSIQIKGEIASSDPVYVYGSVEGSINAPEHRVTIGKEGKVKADITAREVVIMGEVCGDLEGRERVEIRSDGSLIGNLATRRIFIEEGAVLSGVVDVHKPSKKEKAEAQQEQDLHEVIDLEEPEFDRMSVVSFTAPELASEIAS